MPQAYQRLQELDAAHHIHPFNDNAELAKKGTRILTRGEGCYVWDKEGNKLLDAFAGLWCVNIGYGRKSMGQVAARQMDELAYYNTFFQCTTEPAIHLAAKLAEISPAGKRKYMEVEAQRRAFSAAPFSTSTISGAR